MSAVMMLSVGYRIAACLPPNRCPANEVTPGAQLERIASEVGADLIVAVASGIRDFVNESSAAIAKPLAIRCSYQIAIARAMRPWTVLALVRATPDITSAEIADHLFKAHGPLRAERNLTVLRSPQRHVQKKVTARSIEALVDLIIIAPCRLHCPRMPELLRRRRL